MEQPYKSYYDLDAWKMARKLATEAYKLTSKFPKHELYGLGQQIQRCGVSVPSNIAEGYGRDTNKDKNRFMIIARGSLYELETQAIISKDLGYISNEELKNFIEITVRTKQMLNGLIKYYNRG